VSASDPFLLREMGSVKSRFHFAGALAERSEAMRRASANR